MNILEIGGQKLMSDEHWHLKKEVNITHLFATVGLVVSAFVYSTALDKRILANEQQIIFIKAQRIEDVKRSEKQFDLVLKKLDEIQTSIKRN